MEDYTFAEKVQRREKDINELLTDKSKTNNDKIETLKTWYNFCKKWASYALQPRNNCSPEEYKSYTEQQILCEKALNILGYIIPKRKYKR